jgi:signal transduction histidine kinase
MIINDEMLVSYIGAENFKISSLLTAEEKELLHNLLMEMSLQFGVATALSDPDGSPVLEYFNFTELCREHIRGSSEGLRRCKLEAKKRGQQAAESGEPLVYSCHAGIIDFTAPIILLGHRIGNISGGQLFPSRPDEETIRRFDQYFDEIGVADKNRALESIQCLYYKDTSDMARIASIYFRIGKLLSNYFHFQAEYGFWKGSLLKLNEELEQRVKLRTEQLEEKMNQLKNTQMRLIQQEKLAGIGQLAAGVAHEVNNPLGFVISNLSTLDKYVKKFTEMLTLYNELKELAAIGDQQGLRLHLDQLEKVATQKKIEFMKDDASDLLKETQDGLLRIAGIVKSLRVFSRVDASEDLEDFDLNDNIENTLLVVLSEYQDVAEIEKHLAEVPKLRCIGSEFNQVLLGMIVNSAQAIRDSNLDRKGTIKIFTAAEDGFITVQVEDDGCGMNEQVANRMFEPFFTTRPPGKHSGLGMSFAHDIVVNKLHGSIDVQTTVDVGTRITIRLPAETAL